MKQNLGGLSQQYTTALRTFLKQGPRANLRPALQLGRKASALGLEMLDLARIHEASVLSLAPGGRDRDRAVLAEVFFTEVVTPILETHCRNRPQASRVPAREKRGALASINLQLQRSLRRHQVKEAAFKKSEKVHHQRLRQALHLQNDLRKQTHRALSAQEDDRKNISAELQNQVAQNLLGINVRLLALKQEARGNTAGFKNQIAKMQRLVAKSARSVRRFAHELNLGPQT